MDYTETSSSSSSSPPSPPPLPFPYSVEQIIDTLSSSPPSPPPLPFPYSVEQIIDTFKYHLQRLDFPWLEYWLREFNNKINVNKPLMLLRNDDDDDDNYDNIEPIFFSIINDRYDIVQLLIQYKADINCTSSIYLTDLSHPLSFSTPLYYAIYFQSYDIAELLIEYGGADVNAKSNIFRRTPLMEAINNEEFCYYLIKARCANVNETDDTHHTALYHALTHSHYDTAATLIKLGADICENIITYGISQIYQDEKITTEENKLYIFEKLMKNIINKWDIVADAYELFSIQTSDISVKLYCRDYVEELKRNEKYPEYHVNLKHYKNIVFYQYYHTKLSNIVGEDMNLLVIKDVFSCERLSMDKNLYVNKLKEVINYYYYNYDDDNDQRDQHFKCLNVLALTFEFCCLNQMFDHDVYLLNYLTSSSLSYLADFQYLYNILNHLLTKYWKEPRTTSSQYYYYSSIDMRSLLDIISLCIQKCSSPKQCESLYYIIKTYLIPLDIKIQPCGSSLIHFMIQDFDISDDNDEDVNSQLLKFLLNCGICVNSLDNFGKTPLWYANYDDGKIKLLLRKNGHCVPITDVSKYLLPLKCLSARAIQEYKIPYNEKETLSIPRHLIQFIQHHNHNHIYVNKYC